MNLTGPLLRCPEEQPGTECCELPAVLKPKGCFDGHAICDPVLKAQSIVREVPADQCELSTGDQ